ncbi:flagellar basal body rod protein FlgB [Actinomycetes bacterium NPDC127524]
MKLFSNTFQSLESALDYSSLKQKVLSQNIANADTPNYKAEDVTKGSFQDALDSSIKAYRTDARHFDFSGDQLSQGVITRQNVQYNSNGNSVDIDKEMSDLASNQIYYDAASDLISGKFQSLQTIIRGGK